MLRLLAILAVCLSALNAVELSKDVLKEQKEYNEDVAEILKDADKEIKKARNELIDDLEKSLKVAMRKGDLDGAQALQNRIKSLQETGTSVFGDAGKSDEEKSDVLAKPEPQTGSVKVLRAYAQTREGRQDITKHVQKLVDAGMTTFTPSKALAEATGIRNRARFQAEVETADGVKRATSPWGMEVDLLKGSH